MWMQSSDVTFRHQIVSLFDVIGNMFVTHLHVFFSCHWGGEEEVFEVSQHEASAFAGIRDGAVD